jgi:hypothetical protein
MRASEAGEGCISGGEYVANDGLEAWIGKEVIVLVEGEREHWHGTLQDWDKRGVVLHHHEAAIRFRASQGEGPDQSGPHKPMLLLFPWAQVRHVGLFVDDL